MVASIPEGYVWWIIFPASAIVLLAFVVYPIIYTILFNRGSREIERMFQEYGKEEDVQATRALPVSTRRRASHRHSNAVHKVRRV